MWDGQGFGREAMSTGREDKGQILGSLEERGPAHGQTCSCSPSDAGRPRGKAPFPWQRCLEHEMWAPRGLGVPCFGGKSLTTLARVATISGLDGGLLAASLALLPHVFLFSPRPFKGSLISHHPHA